MSWQSYSKIDFKVKYICLKDIFNEVNCKKSKTSNIVNERRLLFEHPLKEP